MSLHLLGIRHHGPGSARSVLGALDDLAARHRARRAARRRRPGAALGRPRRPGATGRPARLGRRRTGPRGFAPLASFSPEWQAIAWANAHEVPVRAIDLPLAVTLRRRPHRRGRARRAGGAPHDPIRDLAAAAGDSDPERWWEDVIEHRGDGAPAFDAVAEAMAAARPARARRRRELQREAHMRRAIRAARARVTDGSSWCAAPGTSPHSTSTATTAPAERIDDPPRCAASPSRRSASPGCRGPTAGSRRTGIRCRCRQPGLVPPRVRPSRAGRRGSFFVDAARLS